MRIGTDIEQISRIRRMLNSTPRFAEKCFTRAERDYCDRFVHPAPHYAVRYCAKEALRKAINRHLDWTDVEVVNEDSGNPLLRFHGEADAIMTGYSVAVSLSHSGNYAIATVILWENQGG